MPAGRALDEDDPGPRPGEAPPAPDPLEAAIEDGMRRLGLDVPEGRAAVLARYVDLLARWNRTYNLTSVRSRPQMVTRHVLDSLAVAPHLEGRRRILDLGTGAGLPGLVLAVCRPDAEWVLLDANGKKTRFCRHAVAVLGLGHVAVEQARAEAFRPSRRFDAVVVRGYGRLAAVSDVASPLLAPRGRVLAMKGRYPGDELEELGPMGENAEVVKLDVPGLDAERHLVLLPAAGGGTGGSR